MMMDRDACDAVVVGGGLAGSAVATLLARKGWRIVLLERESCSHHKVCGEFISVEANSYHARLGLDIEKLGAAPIHRLRLIDKNRIIDTRLPFTGWSLSRCILDDTLLKLAEESGVNVRRGHKVTDVSHRDGSWQVSITGREPLVAHRVFLASGKHDIAELPRRRSHSMSNIAFKRHVQLTHDQTQKLAGCSELTFFDGGYAGLQPIENGLANLCLVVAKDEFVERGKSYDSLLNYITSISPILRARLNKATYRWPRPLAIAAIPYGFVFEQPSGEPDGFYRLGDQMAVIPSLTGDGMAIALYTAFAAADHALKTGSAEYHREARQALKSQIRFALNLSRLSRNSLARRIISCVGQSNPNMIAEAISRTRLRSDVY